MKFRWPFMLKSTHEQERDRLTKECLYEHSRFSEAVVRVRQLEDTGRELLHEKSKLYDELAKSRAYAASLVPEELREKLKAYVVSNEPVVVQSLPKVEYAPGVGLQNFEVQERTIEMHTLRIDIRVGAYDESVPAEVIVDTMLRNNRRNYINELARILGQ